jgi:hypothetical protein
MIPVPGSRGGRVSPVSVEASRKEMRRQYDPDFHAGAVGIVRETGKPIAQVATGPRDQLADPGQLGGQGQGRPGRAARPGHGRS